ncbi:retropepsin-like domain-containing protein [Myxococcota bacterium]|nr:retropepsin-like domain-containing protein [Myxococcota bacterium]MBU1413266.1 retropepsin-like domain-containing protein [Myxococcota bacterium]MBU1510007.1 retropepsin-like domain-containing protein [Myxococcota bacterium]
MKRLLPAACCAALLLLQSFACDSESTPGLEYVGTGGEPVAIRLSSLTPEVMLDLDIEPGTQSFVLDTGSPVHLADVGHYAVEVGVHHLQMTGLGLVFLNLPYVFEDFFAAWVPVSGLLGANLLIYFDWELNYPDRTVTLFPGGFPERDPADSRVNFTLTGGGRYRLSNGDTLDVGATRHLVYVDLEGTRILALVDTGASYMVIKQSVLDTLGTTGRPDHGTTEVVTAYGVISAPLTELETVAFSDAPDATRTSGVYTVVVSDDFLASLRVETGRQVDALIGGAFLSQFRLRFATSERIIDVHTPGVKRLTPPPIVPCRLPPVVEVRP